MSTATNRPDGSPEAAGSEDLLPCPFCGAKVRVGKNARGWWIVRCNNWRCRVEPSTVGRIYPEEAVADWQIRMPPNAQRERPAEDER